MQGERGALSRVTGKDKPNDFRMRVPGAGT